MIKQNRRGEKEGDLVERATEEKIIENNRAHQCIETWLQTHTVRHTQMSTYVRIRAHKLPSSYASVKEK